MVIGTAALLLGGLLLPQIIQGISSFARNIPVGVGIAAAGHANAQGQRDAARIAAAQSAANSKRTSERLAAKRAKAKPKSRLNSSWARRGPIRNVPTGASSKWATRV